MNTIVVIALVFAQTEQIPTRDFKTSDFGGVGTSSYSPTPQVEKLRGQRNWYVSNKWLYIAVSVDELRTVRNQINLGPDNFGWPWIKAQEERTLISVWYAYNWEPFYALRADIFQELQPKFDAVHDGKLPWQITRTTQDDPRTAEQAPEFLKYQREP